MRGVLKWTPAKSSLRARLKYVRVAAGVLFLRHVPDAADRFAAIAPVLN